jgi:hypothetical protein
MVQALASIMVTRKTNGFTQALYRLGAKLSLEVYANRVNAHTYKQVVFYTKIGRVP